MKTLRFTQASAGQNTAIARWGTGILLGALLMASPAQAQTIYGLGTITGSNIRGIAVGKQGLIRINPTTGASLTPTPASITGITAGQTLIGIDFRLADNLLYTLGYDATTAGNNTQLYVLNPATSAVTSVGTAIRLELGGPGERIGFDFNPLDDLIRVVSTNEANYRLNPVSGAIDATDTSLSYSGGTPINPGVGTAAYANSFAGSTATALYSIDYLNSGFFAIQTQPSSGVMTTRSTVMFIIPSGPSTGTYGIGSPKDLGLDLYYNPTTNENVGYLTEVTEARSNGTRASNTYRLNLATGMATLLGNTIPASTLFNFEIRDLAVALPVVPALTWNGNTSIDWSTAANWTPAQVPAAANNVTIPGGMPNQPSVSNTQSARTMALGTGAVLTLTPDSNLAVGAPTPTP